MVFKRFYDEKLAQASYLIGCDSSGEAAVIDPNRDFALYCSEAKKSGLRITAVSETHIHADYLSGARELARLTGATLYLSDEGTEDWKYAFIAEGKAVREGDSFRVGDVRLDVIHTPGHTPEHICFLVTDERASTKPWGLISGDFVFAGDVGRPDLLEAAAGVKGAMEPSARQLFRSLEKFRALPQHVTVWPGHGAGSPCGKSLGSVPVSTIGYELSSNWAFSAFSEQAFVNEVLHGQPEPPKYFATMKRMNRGGPPLLGQREPLREGDSEELTKLLGSGAHVVDLRDDELYRQGFLPGTLNIGYFTSFTLWAGWFLPYDAPLYLISESKAQSEAARRDLSLIGLDWVEAWFDWQKVAEGQVLESIVEWEPKDALRKVEAGSAELIDVRMASEFAADRMPGSKNISLGYLADRLEELPKDRTIALYCEIGVRAGTGLSLLRRAGFRNLANVKGGIMAYHRQKSEAGASR